MAVWCDIHMTWHLYSRYVCVLTQYLCVLTHRRCHNYAYKYEYKKKKITLTNSRLFNLGNSSTFKALNSENKIQAHSSFTLVLTWGGRCWSTAPWGDVRGASSRAPDAPRRELAPRTCGCQPSAAHTCDTGWRRVMQGDTDWHRVTQSDTEWRRVTQWHTVTHSDTEWHSKTNGSVSQSNGRKAILISKQ